MFIGMDSNSRHQNSPCEEIQQMPVVKWRDQGPVDNTYRVLPLFEVEARKNKGIQMYSLKNNERLAKEWRNRMEMLNQGSSERHQRSFPDIGDYHFKNCRTQFIPSLSQKNFPRPHLHLTPGPGPDKYGERPIPIELLIRKSKTQKQTNATLIKETRMLNNKTEIFVQPENTSKN